MSGLICARCGTRDSATTATSGSIFIEIILWLSFIIPGLIYSVWRLTTRRKVCAACGSTELIPQNSPLGQKLSAAAPDPKETETVEVVCPKCQSAERVLANNKFETASYMQFVAAQQGADSVLLGCKKCGHGFSLGRARSIALGS